MGRKKRWVGNTLIAYQPDGTTALLTCFTNRIEIRGEGWDARKTKRNPFPDGRVVKARSLTDARRLARVIARQLERSVHLTDEQQRALERLWAIYGNYGPRHSNAAHHFIQQLLEQGKDTRDFYRPGEEVLGKVDAILRPTAPSPSPDMEGATT